MWQFEGSTFGKLVDVTSGNRTNGKSNQIFTRLLGQRLRCYPTSSLLASAKAPQTLNKLWITSRPIGFNAFHISKHLMSQFDTERFQFSVSIFLLIKNLSTFSLSLPSPIFCCSFASFRLHCAKSHHISISFSLPPRLPVLWHNESHCNATERTFASFVFGRTKENYFGKGRLQESKLFHPHYQQLMILIHF